MPLILLSDVNSYCNKSVRYGNRYDAVTVVSERGHVLIVADRKGNRFPVNCEEVIEISEGDYRKLSEANGLLVELKSKMNTPANARRVQVQEGKLKVILCQINPSSWKPRTS